MTRRTSYDTNRGEVLVAIMKDPNDFAILQEQKWYRIPVVSRPRRWPPQWLALYQTKVFGIEAFMVSYFGRVKDIQIARRCDLFPNEFPNPKSDREYFKIYLYDVERLPQPILSRPRRITFVSTTWSKFSGTTDFNDLFDDSPLEDRLWTELRKRKIGAERQWEVMAGEIRFVLDFAVFCAKGNIDIETDGDTWHANRQRAPKDNLRNNALVSSGWHVLRFNGDQILETMAEYCMPEITQTINRLGGLSDEGLVPRQFHEFPEGSGQQLALFESDAEYDTD